MGPDGEFGLEADAILREAEWPLGAVLPINGILPEQNEPLPLAHVDQAHRALAVC